MNWPPNGLTDSELLPLLTCLETNTLNYNQSLTSTIDKTPVPKNYPLLTGDLMRKLFTLPVSLVKSKLNTMNSSPVNSRLMEPSQDAELDLSWWRSSTSKWPIIITCGLCTITLTWIKLRLFTTLAILLCFLSKRCLSLCPRPITSTQWTRKSVTCPLKMPSRTPSLWESLPNSPGDPDSTLLSCTLTTQSLRSLPPSKSLVSDGTNHI